MSSNEQILSSSELYKKLEDLTEVDKDDLRWLTFYLDEKTGERWVKDYPSSEYHGGGAPRLRRVKEFPKRKQLEEKEEYLGEDANDYSGRLTSVKGNSDYDDENIAYLIDESTGQKWMEDYYSSKETNFDLQARLRKVEKFPWE